MKKSKPSQKPQQPTTAIQFSDASQNWIKTVAEEGQPTPGTPAVSVASNEVAHPLSSLKATNRWAHAVLNKPAEPDFVLPGLEAGEVAMLVSPGGTGKSWWAWLSAISIATGLDLLQLKQYGCAPRKPAKVRYISFEDTLEVLERRMHAAACVYKELRNDENLANLKNLLVNATYYGKYDLLHLDFDELPDEESESKTAQLLEAMEGCRLTIIDTLSQSNSGDENSTKDMAKLVGNLQHLARETKSAIVVLHHTNKGATLNGMGDDASAARGSSTLINNIRCGYFMAGMTELEEKKYNIKVDRTKYVRWGTSKTNHIAGITGAWFEKKAGGVLVPVNFENNVASNKKKGGAL